MNSWEETDRSKHIRDQAWALIDKMGVASTPVNFELWFFYALGHDRDLCRALDAAVQAGIAHDAVRMKEIHTRFFVRSDDRIDNANTTISTELAQLQSALKAVGEGTESYRTALSETQTRLDQANVPGEIRQIVQLASSATAKMTARNKVLEEQVDASQRELTALRIKFESVRLESRIDSLTALANRRAFDERIESAIKDSERDRQSLCILMCDIDRFKTFNDTWGHTTGDQVLRLVAALTKANIKGNDFAARYGGEELAVILPQTQLSDALKVAEHIRAVVESKKIVKKSTGEPLGQVTVSIGIAQHLTGESSSDFITRADAHLYAAKVNGRNRVSWIVKSGHVVPPGTQPNNEMQSQAPIISHTQTPTLELEFVDNDSPLIIDAEIGVVDERLVRLLELWRSARSEDGLPIWQDSFLDAISFVRDCVHLHQVEVGAEELQVHFVGASIIRAIGADPTGVRYSATHVPISGLSSTAIRVFELARLTTSMKEPLRAYSKGTRHLDGGNFSSEILFLPFVDAHNNVSMLLGATIYTPVTESESFAAA